MNTKRMQMLANHLRNEVDGKQFDIHVFHINECGTIACAGGHAAMMPEFIAEGLSLKKEFVTHSILMPNYGVLWGYKALENFFDLDVQTSRVIFSQGGYGKALVTPKMVADMIELTIRNEQP